MIRALSGPLMLGVATGARTSLGLAGVAFAAPLVGSTAPVRKVQGRAGRIISALLVAGELVGDKLPQTPSRLEPQALAGRVVSGGLGGAGLAGRGVTAGSLGAMAGAVGALLGSFGGARARAYSTDQGWPDWPTALVEDVLAIALALTAGRTAR